MIRIDLLGHGGSEKPESGYSIEDQAALVAEALDQLEVQGAVVVGHSLGVGVATALAEQASQLVDRAGDIDQGPDTQDYGEPRRSSPSSATSPVLGQALWRLTPDFAVKDGYGDAFAPASTSTTASTTRIRSLEDFDAMTYTSFKDAQPRRRLHARSHRSTDRLRRRPVPLMVIFGAEDQIVDAESRSRLRGPARRRPRSRAPATRRRREPEETAR